MSSEQGGAQPWLRVKRVLLREMGWLLKGDVVCRTAEMRVVPNGELGTPLLCPPPHCCAPHARSSLQMGRLEAVNQNRSGRDPSTYSSASAASAGRADIRLPVLSWSPEAPAGSRREGLRRLRAQRPGAGGGGASGWLRAQPSRAREAAARRGVALGRISQQGGGCFREFACDWKEGAWPSPTWKKGVWPGAVVGRGFPYLGMRGVACSARRGSGPARAGVRGHGGAVRGGKRCLKRVSKGTRGDCRGPRLAAKGAGGAGA